MERTSQVARAAALVAAVAIFASTTGHAQGGILMQGVADVEGWSTDSGSSLLTRNHARPGTVLRLQLWSAVEPWRGIFLFAQGQAEGGNARAFGDKKTEVALDQAGVRIARDPRFVVNVGKMFHPVGAFAPRILSTRNPLIGIPDAYSPVYPVGAMISGEAEHLDYRVGAVTLPLTHRDYQPRPTAFLRPVVGIGYTPFVGLRIGGTATTGAYLNNTLTPTQTAGRAWQSYHQRLIAPDIEYGVGHLDVRAEYSYASYEVPNAGSISGHAAYVEGRYTVTPRLFVAARGEVNHYPFIRPLSTPTTAWQARRTDFNDGEAGFGFRLSESTVLKASYRADKWTVTSPFVRPGGHAIAIQVSQSFDVMDWVAAVR